MRRRGSRYLAFSVVPLLCLFGLAELVLRFVFPAFDYVVVMGSRSQRLSIWSDPKVWRRVSDARRIVLVPRPSNGVNPEGYRGPAVSDVRDPSVLRILSLGDSTTYGVGVESDQTYSAFLEGMLNDQSCRAEVINAGVPSYTSEQGVAALRLRWQFYRPDLITTYFGNNDSSRVLTRPDRELAAVPSPLSFLSGLLERSRVYLCMQGIALQRIDRSLLVPRVSQEDYRDSLIQIEDLAKRFGAKVWHLRPVTHTEDAFYDGGYSLDLAFLPLRAAFTRSGKRPVELFVDGVHPSVEGHRVIAKYLFSRLRAEGFLEDCEQGGGAESDAAPLSAPER
jgi:lysophospholipase L1-like esterase